MEINKQKPHFKWSQRGLHTRVARCTLLSPVGREVLYISHRKRNCSTASARGRKDSSSSNSTSVNGRLPDLANERTPVLQTLFPSVDSSFTTACPWSIKVRAPPLFPGLASGSPVDHMSWVAILCCSQIKPFFLEKYLTVYLLKVNTCVWWKRTSGGYILFLAVH